jgi:nitrogen fixation protein FixH
MNTANQPKHEHLSQFLWTAFILLFFVLQAILWTFAISFTASDKSHAVVEGYDEQALQWDELRQAAFESEQLGWEASINVGDSADLRGNRTVSVVLTDRDGQPVNSANVSVNVFHFGEAANVQQLELPQNSPGNYVGTLECRKTGYWKFNGTARSDESEFIFEDKVWLEGVK